MTIVRVKHKGNFTQIQNEILHKKEMSVDSRFLLICMLSLPDDWEINPKTVSGRFTNFGKNKVYNILNELILFGYCKKVFTRKLIRHGENKGRYVNGGVRYIIFESSDLSKNYQDHGFCDCDLNPSNKDYQNHGFQDPQLRDSDQKENHSSPYIPNTIRETNKETHSPKPSHNSFLKNCDVELSGFSFIKRISNLPEGLAVKLDREFSSKYPKKYLEEKVAMLKESETIIERPYLWLRSAILQDWKKMPSTEEAKEEVTRKNRKLWKENYEQYEDKVIGNERITSLSQYVEFLRVGVYSKVDLVYWEDPRFQERVQKKITLLKKREKENGVSKT